MESDSPPAFPPRTSNSPSRRRIRLEPLKQDTQPTPKLRKSATEHISSEAPLTPLRNYAQSQAQLPSGMAPMPTFRQIYHTVVARQQGSKIPVRPFKPLRTNTPQKVAQSPYFQSQKSSIKPLRCPPQDDTDITTYEIRDEPFEVLELCGNEKDFQNACGCKREVMFDVVEQGKEKDTGKFCGTWF